MSYTPRPFSIIARALSVLDVRGPMSTADLAEHLDIVPVNVRPQMATAIKHGLAHFQRAGNGGTWHLGMADDAEGNNEIEELIGDQADGEAGDDEFLISLYSDGEVAITGARMTDEGILLSIEQVARLFKFFDHTAGYIEALGQEQLAAQSGQAL